MNLILLFAFWTQDIGVGEESSADQTVLSASPPPPYVPPPALSLDDISAHEPQDRLVHSDVTESLTDPVEDRGGQEGGTGFQFYVKHEQDVEGLSRETEEHDQSRGQTLEGGGSEADRGL